MSRETNTPLGRVSEETCPGLLGGGILGGEMGEVERPVVWVEALRRRRRRSDVRSSTGPVDERTAPGTEAGRGNRRGDLHGGGSSPGEWTRVLLIGAGSVGVGTGWPG